MAKTPAKPYKKDLLEKAKEAVLKHGWGPKKASKYYGVPKSTLYDNTRGRFREASKKKPGRQQFIPAETEAILVQYALEMSDRGYPLTRSAFKILVVQVLRQRKVSTPFNSQTGPSNKWIRSFLKRHRELSLRTADSLDESRANLNQSDVDDYFQLLDGVLQKHSLLPSQIYNMDETGFSGKETFKIKVMGRKGSKRVYQKAVRFPGHTTVVSCAAASGDVIPPLTIFEGTCPDDIQGVPSTWTFSSSKSGYINSEIFHLWFTEVFIKHCGQQRPVLLILDNHTSHISPEVLDEAVKNKIEILCLPPHSTHILQPLDVGYFNLLKKAMAQSAVSLGYGGMRTVPKAKFPPIVHHGMQKILKGSIQSAYRKCGIHPLKPIDISRSLKSLFQSDSSIPVQPDCAAASEETCPTCGQHKENPLVRMGIVPQDLSSVLVAPPPAKVQRRRRGPQKARLVTTEELQNPSKPVTTCSKAKADKSQKSKQPKKPKTAGSTKSTTAIDHESGSQIAGPSGIKQKRVTAVINYLSDEENDTGAHRIPPEQLCCVCKAWSPPGLKNCPDLAIVNWARCSEEDCQHWCHLRFCTKVRVVRRHTFFRCPHCEHPDEK